MRTFQILTFALTTVAAGSTFAAEFSFDRPGAGIGTGITPVGKLAWEQGLPSATYTESTVDGVKEKTVTVNEDMLFRTGLADGLELQLGWQGPAWTQTKRAGKKHDTSGFGDVSIGLKKAIDLKDKTLSWPFLVKRSLPLEMMNLLHMTIFIA